MLLKRDLKNLLRNTKMEEDNVGYICSINYDHHLGSDIYGVTIYPDVESLKKAQKCVNGKYHCGIYKVKVEFIEEVQEEYLYDEDI